MTQTIIGITGRYNWLRRRVWFWQRGKLEAEGWRKSPHEGHIRPMMILRVDAQAETNRMRRAALNAMN